MFGCDGISDHACWKEVFHYSDTKLSYHDLLILCLLPHSTSKEIESVYGNTCIAHIKFQTLSLLCTHSNEKLFIFKGAGSFDTFGYLW